MCAEKERGERERVILGAPNDRQGRGARERERESVCEKNERVSEHLCLFELKREWGKRFEQVLMTC